MQIIKYLTVLGFIFISLFLLSISFFKLNKNEDPRISLGNHLTEIAEYTNNKYGFTCIGTSIAFPEKKFKSAGLSFVTYKQVTKQELYKILYDITIQLLAALNSDVSLKPYIEKYQAILKQSLQSFTCRLCSSAQNFSLCLHKISTFFRILKAS